MNKKASNPVLVEVTRGDGVESVHRGAVAIVDAEGEIKGSLGDFKSPVFPRSAIKSLQALALIETGAADAFNVSEAEIALACASHSSEPEHLEAVRNWLQRLGLSEQDLECGPTGSIEEKVQEALIRSDAVFTRAHNNCSGKHAGFLTTALHGGEPTQGYAGADHPVQQRLLRILEEMGEVDLSDMPRGCDGCGIPVISMPLDAMALGFAKMSRPAVLSPERGAAAKRICAAVQAHPIMIAGHRRLDTLMIEALRDGPKGPALVKTGAEGVYGAILPGLGLGVALKIDDGARRASEVAVMAVLTGLGVLDATRYPDLHPHTAPDVVNAMGEKVGIIRPAAELTEAFA